MKQHITQAIILSRTDYGEADRIITVLTPEYGKLRLMAKGVRRIKSKLAGGIELFSVSAITFVRGRGDIGTLISTRLDKHYGNIVNDLDRTMLGYELIKQLNKITEDQAEADYFNLLKDTFEALNDNTISMELIRFWFWSQLIRLGGYAPNLQTDTAGKKLETGQQYVFDYDSVCFAPTTKKHSTYDANHIKFLRLSFGAHPPQVLNQVQGNEALVVYGLPLVQTLVQTHTSR